MQFFFPHTAEEKLNSLSERLKYLARNKDGKNGQIDHLISEQIDHRDSV